MTGYIGILEEQAEELRRRADELRRVHVDDTSVGTLFAAMGAMREAADTIEGLRDWLQGVMGTRYCELFGTPERAARTLVENHEHQATCLYCIMADRPGNPCGDGDYDALLEWLKGGSDGEHYEIDGFKVVFVPWHSDYMDEDFVAVTVLKDGREVMHAGMTHIEPSEASARKEVELMLMLRGDAE